MSIEFTSIKLSQIPGLIEILQNGKDTKTTDPLLKLNKMEIQNSLNYNNHYKVISYDKNLLSNDLIPRYGLSRSIILNGLNQVVCYAPPKSLPSDRFIENYPLNETFMVAEEFVEGTMINVFWDQTIGLTGGWEISTRNTVGATSAFFKKKDSKNFRTMFLEACKENLLVLEHLNKEYCYSFVLQHPENRIVVPFQKSFLYVVAVYLIENEEDKKEVTVFSMHLEKINSELFYNHLGLRNSLVKFPRKYKAANYAELIETYASMNTPYYVLGVMIHNRLTGERAKIRNPVYEQVRQLRGNQPKLQYQYLTLRNQGKVADFLKFFSENKKEFSEFRDQVHLFTNTLFSNYISCYIKKEKPLIEYSEQYRTHMFHLHKKYLDTLRENKQVITNTIVKKYVNEMHPSLLMYSLNHPFRKRSIDFMKCEDKEKLNPFDHFA